MELERISSKPEPATAKAQPKADDARASFETYMHLFLGQDGYSALLDDLSGKNHTVELKQAEKAKCECAHDDAELVEAEELEVEEKKSAKVKNSLLDEESAQQEVVATEATTQEAIEAIEEVVEEVVTQVESDAAQTDTAASNKTTHHDVVAPEQVVQDVEEVVEQVEQMPEQAPLLAASERVLSAQKSDEQVVEAAKQAAQEVDVKGKRERGTVQFAAQAAPQAQENVLENPAKQVVEQALKPRAERFTPVQDVARELRQGAPEVATANGQLEAKVVEVPLPERQAVATPLARFDSATTTNLEQAGTVLSQAADVASAAKQLGAGAKDAGSQLLSNFAKDSKTEAGEKASKTAVKELSKSDQNEIIQRIQKVLDGQIRTRDANTILLKLDPVELGQVRIKLTQRADELFARIMPERPDVEQLLKTRSQELNQILQQSGVKSENIHVTIGSDSEASLSTFREFMARGDASREGSHGQDAHENGAQQEQAATQQEVKPRSYYEGQPSWVA